MGRRSKIVKNNYKNNYYQTSSAYDYNSFPIEDSYAYKPKQSPKKKKLQVRYVYSDLLAKKPTMSFYITIILLFICATAISMSVANVSLQRRHNQFLGAQLREMENVTNNLAIQVSEARNLEEIKTLAETRLGMSPPEPHQIIYINVPSESSYNTNYFFEPTNVEEAFSIRKYIERLKSFIFKD